MIFSLILAGVLCIVFLILGLYFSFSDKRIKESSTHEINGTVIKYSAQNTRAPVVAYEVEGKTYKKALNYTYMVSVGTPFSKVKSQLTSDIMDPVLRIKYNSNVAIYSVMKERFPIGSTMKVFYNPDNPKIAYVERYAPRLLSKVFFLSSILMLISTIIFYIIIQ